MKRDVFYVSSPARRARVLKSLIFSAEESIILQMYLFAANGELRTLQPVAGPPWAEVVADWLIQRKAEKPGLKIIVLLDSQTIAEPHRTTSKKPVLTRHRLEEAGIAVLTASLRRTAAWRGRRTAAPWECVQEPVEKNRWATLQQRWQTAHNVEDHRKNIVIDAGRAGIVFSHNLIDQARFWQENTILVTNHLARGLYAVARSAALEAMTLPVRFSAAELALRPWLESQTLPDEEPRADAGLLDGGPEIRRSILDEIARAHSGEIRAASAYCSDLESLHSLSEAAKHTRVRILIDSCNALALPRILHFFLRNTVNILCLHFCRKTPQLELRIFPSTQMEMMHMKAISFSAGPCLIAGQANFTPNSFSGAWLETSLLLRQGRIVDEFNRHFDELWARSERVVPYTEMSLFKYVRVRARTFVFLFLVRIAGWFGFRY